MPLITFNPFTDNLDFVGSGGTIPEYASDPLSPAVNSAWVLKTVIPDGTPIGLLLALTYTSEITYQFSYRTSEGTTVRTQLV